MVLAGLQRVTLIDFPERIACVVFTHGCPFRCFYCHNPELVVKKPSSKGIISQEEFFSFLKTRQGKLDGVVVTGGEPLLNPDLEPFLKEIKDMGFCIKLDTNGSFPKQLESLIEKKLIDFLAMDVKCGLKKYKEWTGWDKTEDILSSIKIIIEKAPNYEFRTTVVKGFHTEEDIIDVLKLIKGAKTFAIQNFRDTKTISGDLNKSNEFRRQELEKLQKISKRYISNTIIRNSY